MCTKLCCDSGDTCQDPVLSTSFYLAIISEIALGIIAILALTNKIQTPTLGYLILGCGVSIFLLKCLATRAAEKFIKDFGPLKQQKYENIVNFLFVATLITLVVLNLKGILNEKQIGYGSLGALSVALVGGACLGQVIFSEETTKLYKWSRKDDPQSDSQTDSQTDS